MADDSRAVRILSDLCGVLRREKNIREFGFVYCPEPLYNKSPIVVVDGNLGIETWSIKILYSYAHTQLFHSGQIQHDLKRVSDCSMAVLLLNPECLSAWNLRKQLVLKKYLKAEKELNLARLVLSKHPKSPDTFSQRRWLLQQMFPSSGVKGNSSRQDGHQAEVPGPTERLPGRAGLGEEHEAGARGQPEMDETLMACVRTEMEVCALAAGRYPSNYNAWSHRIWVVKNLAGNPPQFLHSELAATKPWVSLHISDHSGFHYRQFLLRTLARLSSSGSTTQGGGEMVSEAGSVEGLVLGELQLILDLVTSYPGHEAVWYHRRFVVSLWKTLLCNGITWETPLRSSYVLQPPSVKDPTIRDCSLLLGKRPSENHQIGNQPLGKRPSENQPIRVQQLSRPVQNLPAGNGASARHPSENGHIQDADLTRAVIGRSRYVESQAASRQVPGVSFVGGDAEAAAAAGYRQTRFSAMQLPSTCSHDASLLHLSDQHISHESFPLLRPLHQAEADSHSPSPREASRTTDDAFSSTEILRLKEHEQRFINIVVEGTHSADKAMQRRCAESYCRWLDNLH